jgi:hypothetical protein
MEGDEKAKALQLPKPKGIETRKGTFFREKRKGTSKVLLVSSALPRLQ